MPSSKQAKKRVITDDRRRLANKAKNSAMKSAIKKVVDADTKEAAAAALPAAVKMIDKCAKHNIIHANGAARRKSSLDRHIAAL
ncbi:MAG: 30S ribosomal protein S20 [Planctomycetota bacterium]|jgi:small subunit ribosomal protein S20|nr:30S ribosomal protein S20 [Candidatus Woesearchaeota archaeon]MBV21158.1 30S ribosomal protein S20 [Planctomycetaceae bacterium]MDP6385720.1 30S ribosomal protein S20 [Planctomycetota bacterium]MDP6938464.1 30S ribosomal protein S20 [Planctomycetota bacterium]HJM57545.1 30S ribosomal protein S20 [Planctomycetota bacterium]